MAIAENGKKKVKCPMLIYHANDCSDEEILFMKEDTIDWIKRANIYDSEEWSELLDYYRSGLGIYVPYIFWKQIKYADEVEWDITFDKVHDTELTEAVAKNFLNDILSQENSPYDLSDNNGERSF